MTIFFHIALSLGLVLVMNFIGNISRQIDSVGSKYVNLPELQKEKNIGFNLVIRILSPAIYISFFSIIFYKLGLDYLITSIWLVTLYYFIIMLIILLVLNRFPLINKPIYFLTQILSIYISYFIYDISLKHGLNFILPDETTIRSQIWIVIIGYFYTLFNNIRPDPQEDNRKVEYITNSYHRLKNRYNSLLTDQIKDNKTLNDILFSIMIIEDFNRPYILRVLEKLFHRFGIIKTTGIMQITSNKELSDEESIKSAEEIISKIYNKYKSTNNTYQLLNELSNYYNGNEIYQKDFNSVFYLLQSLK